MSKQVAVLLLGLLISMLGLVIWSFFVPGSMDGTAEAHKEITGMLQSKGNAVDNPLMVLIGSLLGILAVSVIGINVWVGVLKGGQENTLGRWMLRAFGIYVLIFGAISWTYLGFIEDPITTQFIGAFPIPSAIMIYGVWFFPLVFVGLYTFMFKTHVLTHKDVQTFRDMVQQSGEAEG